MSFLSDVAAPGAVARRRHIIRPSEPVPISSLMPDPEPVQVIVTPDPFEERRSERDTYAAQNGATEGSPNYEERAAEFDRRAIAELAPQATVDADLADAFGIVEQPGVTTIASSKRPYQRTGTAALAAVATIGEGSALGDGVPDPEGVGAELAWRHKPAAHRLAESLGCEAGTRAYQGSRNALPRGT